MTLSEFKTPILIASFSCFLAGCSANHKEIEDMPVEPLYAQAKASLDEGSFSHAAKLFSEVERQHPYSIWSLRAQLMAAYSYYEGKKYDEAIEGFNTFIQLHPGHESVPYAYYMIGLCYYEQIPHIQRNQEAAEKAQMGFQEVINRFPRSDYAKDAKFKLDLIIDHFAGKEIDVGRYYLNQRAYIAALNRFKYVVEHYQTSSYTPEALHRMVECYLALGIDDQARVTASILGYNYPGNPWYADTYTLMQYDSVLDLPKGGAVKSDSGDLSPKVSAKPPVP